MYLITKTIWNNKFICTNYANEYWHPDLLQQESVAVVKGSILKISRHVRGRSGGLYEPWNPPIEWNKGFNCSILGKKHRHSDPLQRVRTAMAKPSILRISRHVRGRVRRIMWAVNPEPPSAAVSDLTWGASGRAASSQDTGQVFF